MLERLNFRQNVQKHKLGRKYYRNSVVFLKRGNKDSPFKFFSASSTVSEQFGCHKIRTVPQHKPS